MQSVTYYFNNNTNNITNNKLKKIKKYFNIKPLLEDFADELDDLINTIFHNY
tara:strand:+ start:3612 stop:3767 length:156 start_codon:yes stop_codon:yes gene_type:complete